MHGQRFQTGRSCFITGFGKTRENEGEGGCWLCHSVVLCAQHLQGAGTILLWLEGPGGNGGMRLTLPHGSSALQKTPPQSCGRPR